MIETVGGQETLVHEAKVAQVADSIGLTALNTLFRAVDPERSDIQVERTGLPVAMAVASEVDVDYIYELEPQPLILDRQQMIDHFTQRATPALN